MVAFPFCPKIFGRGRRPKNDNLSVCEGSLNSTRMGGGDTHTLTAEIKFIQTS